MKGRKSFLAKSVRLGSLAIAVVVSLLAVQHVNAATPKTSLAISPPLFELSANPGDTVKHSIRLDNLTDKPLPISLDKKDFVALGEEGQATLTDHPSAYSLASWINIKERSFTLAPKASRTIAFTIKIPQKAEPGGHFGSIVFHTQSSDVSRGTGAAVGQEIGALLLMRVAGTAKEEASLASFRSTRDVWEEGPILFETRFRNSGNVQLKPSGTITVSNMFGQKIGSIPIDSRTVLPDSIRKITATWNEGLWPGWYTATASIGYGSKDQLLTSTASFSVFPYKIIVPIVVVLAMLALLIYKARARLWRSLQILFGKE